MKTVGIVACSNAQSIERKEQNERLIALLEGAGNSVLVSRCIYETNGAFSGTGEDRAAELMRLFSNPAVEEIYDISGGDLANEVLDWLDFEQIRASKATFWGYSDLSTVINAIYAQTGKSSVLYQVKNLVCGPYQGVQRQRFFDKTDLFQPSFRFVQGSSMEGVVVGGNIRCFLKLAGTKYFPDFSGKILLLESLGGEVPQMVAALSQLKSCGAFETVNGVLLGTFSKMEENHCTPDMPTLVQSFLPKTLPLAQTREIGHGFDSKALRIGEVLSLRA